MTQTFVPHWREPWLDWRDMDAARPVLPGLTDTEKAMLDEVWARLEETGDAFDTRTFEKPERPGWRCIVSVMYDDREDTPIGCLVYLPPDGTVVTTWAIGR